MAHHRATISPAVVSALPAGHTIQDTGLKGFGVRRQKGATITYFVRARVNGALRFLTIGHHGQPGPDGTPWNAANARKRAMQLIGNPTLADKPAVETVLTYKQVAEQFFALHGPKLKPRTLEEYQRLDRLYLDPAFGHTPITGITRAMVSNTHVGWKANPRAANHALSVLSKLLAWCEDQGYRPEASNPCRKVERFAENKREKFLTAADLAKLGAALEKAQAGHLAGEPALAAIRLLILTGARLTEILTLQWSWIDLERKIIFLPDSKTGQKPIHLNDEAIAVLSTLPRFANNPYVIVGNRHGTHLVNLQKPWQIVRKLAGLDTTRIHDLRHTFASVSVAKGGSLPIIGAILGHSQPQTTQRYAHLSADPLRELTQTTGKTIADAMRAKPAAK